MPVWVHFWGFDNKEGGDEEEYEDEEEEEEDDKGEEEENGRPTTYGRLMLSHISRATKSAFWRPTLPSTSRNVLTRLRKNKSVSTAPPSVSV